MHARLQVKEDVYEKIDKELLEYVEDVLLNRCENATERLLEFAGTLEPKSKPCAVVRKGAAPELKLTEKVRCLLPHQWGAMRCVYAYLCTLASLQVMTVSLRSQPAPQVVYAP